MQKGSKYVDAHLLICMLVVPSPWNPISFWSGTTTVSNFVFDGPWVPQGPPGVVIGAASSTRHVVYIDAARLGGGAILGHPEASIVVPASSNTWILTRDDGTRYKMVMIEVTFFMGKAYVYTKAAGFTPKRGPMTSANVRAAWEARKPQGVCGQDGHAGYGVVYLAGRIGGVSVSLTSAALNIHHLMPRRCHDPMQPGCFRLQHRPPRNKLLPYSE